jgi:NADH dehydrogenase FAD-containing subunit
MSETRNIVILGANFAGLSAAHYIVKHTLPQLAKSPDAKYVLHIVNESTHFWWHIGAPRELISVKDAPHDKYFKPIMEGFKQYPQFKDSIIFHQGSATGIDVETRTVTYAPFGSEASEALPYYALVIATGVRSPTPCTTLHGDHNISIKALDEMNTRLASASEIIIGGGGPIAVETAGEIGTKLNSKARITLITSSDKLLPSLRKALAEKAQSQLAAVGVTVLYNTKISSHTENADGKTEVHLSTGKSLTADVYIPAIGVTPSTSFVPEALKQAGGWINANPSTLRVDAAGPRVYAVGDVAKVDKGGVLNLYASIPVFGANFAHDVLGEAGAGVGAVPAERAYKPKNGETQLVPVGPKSGVGAFNGWKMPAFAISMIKGKDYMAGEIPKILEGKQFTKA